MRHYSWQFHSLLRLYCMHACPIQNYYYVFARVGCMRFVFSSCLQHTAFLASVNPIESWFNYYLTSDDIDIWKANINSLICYSNGLTTHYTKFKIKIMIKSLTTLFQTPFTVLRYFEFHSLGLILHFYVFFSNFPCCFSVNFILF